MNKKVRPLFKPLINLKGVLIDLILYDELFLQIFACVQFIILNYVGPYYLFNIKAPFFE